MCAHPEQRVCAGTVWWPLHSSFSKPVYFTIWIISPTCASPRTRANSEETEVPEKDLAFLRFASRFDAANFRRSLAQQPGNSISRFPDDRGDCRPASQFQVLTDLAPIEPHCAPDIAKRHEPFGHPRIDGPRRYLHPYRHFHFRDMLIICTKFILHRSSGAARHGTPGAAGKNSKILTAGGEELRGSSWTQKRAVPMGQPLEFGPFLLDSAAWIV